MKVKFLGICIIITLLFILTGCDNEKETSENKIISRNTSKTEQQKEENPLDNIDFKTAAENQMSMPEEGETIAIMHVKDFGDIKFKFLKM